jgi:hypothetical protein
MYAGERNETDTRLERLIAMLKAARCAPTHSELDALEEEADSILVAGVTTRRQAGGDAHSFSALALALDQVRFAIEARRRALPPPTI